MIYDVRGLRFAYPNGHQVINDASFTLDEGEVLTILGPNGAGKSTLFNCLANIRRPTGGEILLGGSPMDKLSVKEVAGLIGYVQQTHIAVFDYTVIYFVMRGRAARVGVFSRPKAEDRAIAMQALETLGIAHLAERPYTAISGGERQLVLIARALVQDAKVLILDEPTANLDYGNQIRVMEQLRQLNSQGYTVVQSTHNPEQAFLFSHNVVAMQEGRVLAAGAPSQVVTEELMEKLYGADIRVCSLYDDRVRVCIPRSVTE